MGFKKIYPHKQHLHFFRVYFFRRFFVFRPWKLVFLKRTEGSTLLAQPKPKET